MRIRYRTRAIVCTIPMLLPLVGCAPAVALPDDSAGPEVVLETYLRALVAGDCGTGRALATATFREGNGELCGAVDVSAFRIEGGPLKPSPDEAVFSTILTTSGSVGSIKPGETIRFYSLDRQPDGSWRIVAGGSGP